MYGRPSRHAHGPNPNHQPHQHQHQQHQGHAPFPTHPSPCTTPHNCSNHHNAWTTAMHHMRTLGVSCPDHLIHIWLHRRGSDPHADSTRLMFEAMGRSIDVDEHLGLLPPRGMFPTEEEWDGAPSRGGGGMLGDEMGGGGRGGAREMGFTGEYRHGFDGRRGGERDPCGGRRPGGEGSEDGYVNDGLDGYEIESSDDEEYGRRRGHRGGSRGPPRGGRNGRGRW